MKREDAVKYVSYVVDDSLNGRLLNEDPTAIVREHDSIHFNHPSVLVGWQCGFEPLFVAVHSYLDVFIPDDEAMELATEYLEEINWFGDSHKNCDYIIR